MKRGYLFLIGVVVLTLCCGGSVWGDIEYLAVFMEGQKVGHAILTRVVTGAKVVTTEEVSITISRAGIPITINSSEVSIETSDGKPLGFKSVQDLGLMMVEVEGTVTEQGTINLTTRSMGAEQKQTMEWPAGAIMAEGLRLLALKKGLKEGTEYSAKIFSAGILQALDARIRIGAKRNVDLLGRVVFLTEATTDVNLPGAGRIVTSSYVDDELRTQKTVMPIAGMRVEMVACTKEVALSTNEPLDLINKMFIPSPQPLDNVGSAESITYYLLAVPGANDFSIPSTDNQTVSVKEDGTVVVTVRPVSAPAGAKFPYKGRSKELLEALEPTRFLQSDRKEIVELAKKAVGNTKDAAKAAGKIESFVATYIDNKSLSVGYASAAEVAASRQGDCSEFAVLTAAMCRSVGIPARVVAGVAYIKNFAGIQDRFGGHAWVEAYVGGKWVGLDAAFKSAGLGGYEAGHIALAVGNGNPEDFFNLVNTLGRFRIYKVIVHKKLIVRKN